MRKLIITSIAVLAIAVLPMSNAHAGCNWNSQQGQWVGNCVGEPQNGYSENHNYNNNHNYNSNYNRNTNTNRNTNVQGQMQGQAQGQAQSVNNTNDVNVDVNIDNSGGADTRDASANANVVMRGVRDLPAPGYVQYPALPSYFGNSVKSSNVQSAETMVMYKDTFTRAEVEEYLHMVSIDHNREGEFMSWKDKKAEQTIKVVLAPPAKGTVVQTALITTKAKNEDTESKDVLYSALLSGLDSGADLLYITSEGARNYVKAFGWGIGFSHTKASLSADESEGSSSSGGFGISGGKSEMKALPWIQAIGLKLK